MLPKAALYISSGQGNLNILQNHSRTKPNACAKVVEVDKIPRLCLFAVKMINPGNEIMFDYGDHHKLTLVSHPWLNL